ncbi:creatinine amidohydrolase [Evansella caseinilytica]|uniref:Creatinine amidohydrolase n=1 Tax=Evansella caseinilytica TaxID=1503961 RepID=A0A1H3UH55_9BACI|nr:creatininase family protein [Evansella caseinilytica]SDZ61411.1 creatinine amidohydrolase [Evansella caseinilytica]
MQYQYRTSSQIKEDIAGSKVAILPVGAVEAHGPHLPLGTDNVLAERLAGRLAEQVDALVLPILPYGQVWSLRHFPGSITIRNQSLIDIVVDIGKSLYTQGIELFVIVNGHLGNGTALKEAARELYDACPELKVVYLFYPGMQKAAKKVRETPALHDAYFHACELETSFMLYLAPEYVNMAQAICDMPDIPVSADATPTPWEEFTSTAVLGDATAAKEEKGEFIINISLKNMVRIIRDVQELVPKDKNRSF